MLFVSPLINLLFWLMYLPCSIAAFFFIRSWRELNGQGIALTIALICVALCGGYGLVTTSVMPLV